MEVIETSPREIGFVLWGHCQNLLDDPRRCKVIPTQMLNLEKERKPINGNMQRITTAVVLIDISIN